MRYLPEETMAGTKLTILDDGSIRVEGDFEIVDPQGRAFGLAGRTRVTLCRCGQSSRKPFCDSTHKTCGFQSTVVAFDLEPPAPRPGS
jgi:CDGSH-type Zn-finger protein